MTEQCIPPERTFVLPMQEVARRISRRIRGALTRLAQNDGHPATWCPECANQTANPWPPTDSEGEE